MAHGYPTGYTRLYDDDGNPVDVEVVPDGTRALSVNDVQVKILLREMLERIPKRKKRSPWDMKSPWSRKDSHE